MTKIKVAVIGAGNMGMHHVRNYYYHPGVELIGMVDNNDLRLGQLTDKFPISTYKDYRDVIDLVDAVSVVTPTSTHYPIARDFLKKGKHVLLEKPMTANLQEAKKLLELSKEKNAVLSIGHIERFNPVISELFHLLQENKPLYIDIHRESPYDPRIFDVDVIADLMIHDIDLLNYLLNEPFKIKSANGICLRSASNDLVNVQLVSDSGVLVNLTTSRITEQKIRNWRLVMPDMLIEADLLERKLYITRRTSVRMHIEGNNSGTTYKQEQLVEKVLVPSHEPLQMEIADFISAIQSHSKPKISGMEGYTALKMVKDIKKIADKNIVYA